VCSMPRRDIRMSDAEVDEFLRERRQMVVGAIDKDGWPVATIAAVRYGGGQLAVALPEHDPVRAALTVDRRVCCVDDEHASYYEIKGVIVHGRMPDVGPVEIDRVISFDFARLR
jgi:nitroimidazol reductase NimA-like FMN-containing flavoprotein (pyridoxamine 5'-phosphate oxidase superfamily)